jgi:small subunit ribosomal protein S1
MSWSQHLRNPQDFLKVGDEMEAVVLTLDRAERKMSLGIKQLTEDPWNKTDLLSKYAVGTKHKGTVRNLTNFGLFLELEEGIDGLVHVSDLSWTKKIKHPSEFVKVGDSLDVIVIELDADNRRLALGHKQLEENPWDTFESVFTVGSVHKATVISKNDKMATLELPYGIEGLAPLKQLTKADESVAEAGEALDFVVTEFHKDDRKIILSHTRTFSGAPVEEVKVEKKKATKTTEKTATVTAEKSTMGDIGALSALKEQMEGAEREQAIKKLEKKSKKAE